MSRKFVCYLRVSTARQGKSGLGLEAQRSAITEYLNGGENIVLAEYVEVESGKNNSRVKLLEALAHCKITGAILIIAKLDRLSRNLHFITTLMESGTEFIACDLLEANRLTVHILAAMAEHEGRIISERTKSALRAAKGRGVILGNPGNLNAAAASTGRKIGTASRIQKADRFAADVRPMIDKLMGEGLNHNQIAKRFNQESILTARGKTGSWTATAVGNILHRHSSN